MGLCNAVVLRVPDSAALWTALLSMEFSRQEYWSGLPFPIPGDLPDLGIEFAFLASPALVGGFCTTALPEKPLLKLGREYTFTI